MRNWNSFPKYPFISFITFILSSTWKFLNFIFELATLLSGISFSSRNIIRAREASIECRCKGTRSTVSVKSGEQLSLPITTRRAWVKRTTEWCGRMWWCTLPYLGYHVRLLMPHQYYLFSFENTQIIFSLLFVFIFFHPHNFNLFYRNIKN